MAKAKVTTVKAVTTEVIMGKASTSIERSVSALGEGLNILKDLFNKSADLDLEIATKQQEKERIKVEIDELKRSSAVELEVSMRQNEAKVVDDILAKHDKVAIEEDKWMQVKAELARLKADFDKEVSAATGKAEAIAKARYEKEKEIVDAQQKAHNAGIVAENKVLAEKVKFLEEQITKMSTQLGTALEANVKIAEAQKGASINMGGK